MPGVCRFRVPALPPNKGQAAPAVAATERLQMTDQEIEREIQEKGLTAPRVTPERIEECIVSEHYFRASDGVIGVGTLTGQSQLCPDALTLLTFCVLRLKNGFTVTGESACASPENFDAEIGRKIARQNAVTKIWALEGYVLRNKLAGIG